MEVFLLSVIAMSKIWEELVSTMAHLTLLGMGLWAFEECHFLLTELPQSAHIWNSGPTCSWDRLFLKNEAMAERGILHIPVMGFRIKPMTAALNV